MNQILTMNSISPVYADILPDTLYHVAPDAANPVAVMVRSADMHTYTPEENLLCVARAGAGVNNIPLDDFAQKGIVVFNTPGANANAVKELVIAGLLLASRKIADGIEWCRTLKDGEKTIEKQVEAGKGQFTGPEIAGKTLGVIGLGAIGVQVANTGTALGMNVLGYDPYISVEHAWHLSRAVVHSTDLNEVLEKSDYITVHVPLMDSTRGMIGEKELAAMKPTAAVLNFARDALVDTSAIVRALEEGKIRTYITDFPTSSLIGVRNVTLIPHLGASTPESEDNCVRMAASEIDDYLKTGSITNSVNYPGCRLGPVIMPRIAVLHRNVPNVISSITQVLSTEGLNIENMVNVSRGSYAYTAVDVGSVPSADLISQLSALETIFRVRLLLPQ